MTRAILKTAVYDPDARELLVEFLRPTQRSFSIRNGNYGLEVFDLKCGVQPVAPPPDFVLHAKNLPSSARKATSSFWASLPKPVREAAAPFVWKQLPLIQFLTHSPHALELMATDPLLGWLLADCIGPGLSLVHALSLARSRRSLILETVLGRKVQGGLKFLRKVCLRQYDREACHALRSILHSPHVVQALRHNRTVDLASLQVVLPFPEALQLPVIRRELAQEKPSPYRTWMLRMIVRSCLRFKHELPAADFRTLLDSCKTLEDLRGRCNQLHNRFNTPLNTFQAGLTREREAAVRLEEEVRQRSQVQARARRQEAEAKAREQATKKARKKQQASEPFPNPPLPGNEWIVPIRTLQSLRQESRHMDNCVKNSSYLRRIRSGHSYIYSVFFPERCTLELEITPAGVFIEELKAFQNAPPRRETRAYVRAWLEGRPPE